jgi:hypothetical protein
VLLDAIMNKLEIPKRPEVEGAINEIINALERHLLDSCGSNIDSFLGAHDTDTWIVSADFSFSIKDFPQDSMVIALIPLTRKTFPPTRISQYLPHDLKNCRKPVDREFIDYLRNGPFFVFAFLIDREGYFYQSQEIAKKVTECSIAMCKAWPTAQEPQIQSIIKSSQACLKDYKTKTFFD